MDWCLMNHFQHLKHFISQDFTTETIKTLTLSVSRTFQSELAILHIRYK